VKTVAKSGSERLFPAPRCAGKKWDAPVSFEKVEGVDEADIVGFGKAAPEQNYVALYIVGRVGTVRGSFRSDDRGKRWVRLSDDLHRYDTIYRSISGDPRVYGRGYLGTSGRGIFQSDVQTR